MVPQWLFGPAGDLRPVPPPERSIDTAVSRSGGTHTSITGSVTVDRIAYRAGYTIKMEYADVADFEWLEALYTGAVSGPLYLIDPMRVNLLQRESTQSRGLLAGGGRGVSYINGGVLQETKDFTVPVSNNTLALHWTGIKGPGKDGQTPTRIAFQLQAIPLHSNTQLTGSIYVKPDTACTMHLHVEGVSNSTQGQSWDGPDTLLPADQWTRVSATAPRFVSPPHLTEQYFYLYGPVTSTGNIAAVVSAPQVEYGTSVSDFRIGGGCLKTAISSMKSQSPRYPYRSVTLDLQEE